MNNTIRGLLGAGLVVAAFGAAVAKLPPAPPMTDQQKAEKAAKDKATADAAKAELARAEDKAVANYMSNMKAKGVSVNPPQLGPGVQPPAAPAQAAPTQAAAQPAAGAQQTPAVSGAQPSPSDAAKGLPSEPEKASNAHSPAKK
jgi:hypothetical protein